MTKAEPKARTVYPVDGRYINGVPHVAHDCTDPFCVASGAFTHDPPPQAKAAMQSPDPADAGSSDSQEV